MRENGSAALRGTIAVAVLAAAYVALALFLGRHVPANTSVAGVPIGGMTPDAAVQTLERALAPKAKAPVVIQAGETKQEIQPADAGLAFDLPGTVEGLTGFSLSPTDLWTHLTGGSDEPLETTVDRDKLEAAVGKVGGPLNRKVVEGAIAFADGKVKVTDPVAGRTLSATATADEIAKRWPTEQPVAAKFDTTEPKVSAAEVERATKEFAAPAVSGPVKVVAGSKTFSVAPAEYADALSMKADASGKLQPVIDDAKVVAAVRAAAAKVGLEKKAQDAKITFNGTTPVVTPAVVGSALEPKSIDSAFTAALTSADRTAKVATTVVQPKLTTAEANKIKPKERISTFSTQFPYNPPRTENISIAARTLNGTYVAPGETFSLNAKLGQRTAAKGYNSAPVIINGRLTKDYGGGISQLSTTLFNAIFFSGAKIEEHHPHSFYISRYPEGREATISWPDVDNRFTNDTGYGILIQAGVSGNSVTVSFYGTKVWDIEAVKGPRRNVVQPKSIVDNKKGCVPQSPTPGFDVTVTRIFNKGGKQVKSSQFNTHYIPEDKVTCTNP